MTWNITSADSKRSLQKSRGRALITAALFALFALQYGTGSPPVLADEPQSGALSGTFEAPCSGGSPHPVSAEPPFAVLTDAECWQRLPQAVSGSGQSLPI
jgi:hypothetical protein